MKNKKRYLSTLSAVTLCSATLIGAGLYPIGSAYAAYDETDPLSIYIYDSSSSVSCSLYNNSSDPCEASYGTYDATERVLTLGSSVNGKSLNITRQGSVEPNTVYTIKTTADIEASIGITGGILAQFDFDGHSFSIPTDSNYYLSLPNEEATGVVFASGTYNLDYYIDASIVAITGGTVNLTNTNHVLAKGNVNADIFTISDGSLNITNGDLKVKDYIGIWGGTVNINNPYGYGAAISLANDEAEFDMSAGTVSIDVGGTVKDAINGYGDNQTFNISGGNLNINNASNGIAFERGSTITFDGGTTTIKNSGRRAVLIDESTDPENAISFGEDIGIKEPNLYVFWVDEDYDEGDNTDTGIVATDTLTVAEGYTYRKVYGWEIGDGSDDVEVPNTSDVKAPDTGIFSGLTDKTTATIISLGAIATVSGLIYSIAYLVKRLTARVKFNK